MSAINHHVPVLEVALPTPLRRTFDYLPPQDVDINTIVPLKRILVPFGSRQLVGIVVSLKDRSALPVTKLKLATAVLDLEPIMPVELHRLCAWAASYYHGPIGDVLMQALPSYLRKVKDVVKNPSNAKEDVRSVADIVELPHSLNAEQQLAVDAVLKTGKKFNIFLLDGVTGSGKTEVYLQVIQKMMQQDLQVLVLVPEINLTPQTIQRFQARFSVPVFLMHSGLSEKKRYRSWQACASGEAKIIIGTRSAVFAPFKNLGLIIVDEEHDQSFKQQERFRYHARDVAIKRASLLNIPIVLGSATPSLESLRNAKNDRYQLLKLHQRAGNASQPQFELLNIRQSVMQQGIAKSLIEKIKITLAKDQQVLLFLNRRGFAPAIYCTQCTHIVACRRCDAYLVYHDQPPRLHCHHCDARSAMPARCEECSQASLEPIGMGTQRLEKLLQSHFADVPIFRVDRDNMQGKDAIHQLLAAIHATPRAILIGTQMLAKGHHFPDVTLVGVMDVDHGLFSADFRASENLGQLLLQVAGRAGRAEKRGQVVIQTRYPDHPLLELLIQQGYAAFAQQLLLEREKYCLPPYHYLAIFRAESYQLDKAVKFLENISAMVQQNLNIEILGPVAALIAKKKGLHCQHLLIKAQDRQQLHSWIKKILSIIDQQKKQSVKWSLDIDPLNI